MKLNRKVAHHDTVAEVCIDSIAIARR